MLTLNLIVITVIAVLAWGTLWHNQPARDEDPERAEGQLATAPSEALFRRRPSRKAHP